jgi:hypothetical protein
MATNVELVRMGYLSGRMAGAQRESSTPNQSGIRPGEADWLDSILSPRTFGPRTSQPEQLRKTREWGKNTVRASSKLVTFSSDP